MAPGSGTAWDVERGKGVCFNGDERSQDTEDSGTVLMIFGFESESVLKSM